MPGGRVVPARRIRRSTGEPPFLEEEPMKSPIALALTAALVAAPSSLGAAGTTEPLTPGWDAFPGLTSGSVEWSVAAGSSDFEMTYTLDGASGGSAVRRIGFHHMDAVGRISFGGGKVGTDDGAADPTSREGHSTTSTDTEIGFITVDGSGDGTEVETVFGVNPGVYSIQFHVREGGPPGCPTTGCNVIYRTGAPFSVGLVRFAIPGSAAFWSGDGDADDEGGTNGAAWSGTEEYRSGHFREGFDLDGASHLEIASPTANGLVFASGFTVAAWIEQDAFASTASILNLRTSANSSGWALEPTFQIPGSVTFGVNTSGVAFDHSILTVAGFGIGERHHVAATFDAATHTIRLYRDGALAAEKSDVPGTTISLLGTESMQIGRNLATGALFDGLIDELLYFDRALAPGEIGALTGALFADGFESGSHAAWSGKQL
jgi:hypothetical protein